MANALQEAYFEFWRKAIPFGAGFLPVFPRDAALPDQPFPYLTYDIARCGFGERVFVTAYIYTRSSVITQVEDFASVLFEAIPEGGAKIDLQDNKGRVIFRRGNPFSQSFEQEDRMIKVRRILIEAQHFILGG